MADYWKSQPRKFCEICKCWMADNKPSRDFHERGKRHQDNMKKRLDDMRRKNIEDAKKDREVKSYLMEMERGAMLKFRQDLAQDPKLAAKYGVSAKSLSIPPPASYSGWSQTSTQNQQKRPTEKNNYAEKSTFKKKKGEAIYPQPNPNAPPEETVPTLHGDWQEVMTDDGHLYYWNSKTGESSWFLPGTPEYDDYIRQMANMPAGQAAAYFQGCQQSGHSDTVESPMYPQTDEDITSLSLPSYDYILSLETKDSTLTPATFPSSTLIHEEGSIKDEDHKKVEDGLGEVKSEVLGTLDHGPEQKNDCGEIYAGLPQRKKRRDDTSIYGHWQEIRPPATPKGIDLQLPQSKKTKICTIVVPKETKFVIKEKTVAVSHKPPVDFKKKSENCQSKNRNLRKRACDDDI